MGCCMSTQQASLPYQPPPKRRRLADPDEESVDKGKDDASSRKTAAAPPTPPLLYVEEKVKGVLIETHFANPKPISMKQPQNQTLNLPKPLKTPKPNNVDPKWSTKTTPLSKAPPSMAGMPPARSVPKRERAVVQSPTRKPGSCPGRVNGGLVKMVQSRESGSVVSKADPVLGPWKRSGSPVARVSNGVGRPAAERSSSIGRRNPSSPGRVRRDPIRKGKGHAVSGQVNVNGKESLESPLVSLECFIFL